MTCTLAPKHTAYWYKLGNALPSPISLPKRGLTFVRAQGSCRCVSRAFAHYPLPNALRS
jgi:hypothetical protein